MKKKAFVILAIVAVLLAAGLLIYPHITIQTDDQLIACRYSDDISEFESQVSADERYTYYAEKDVTWTGFDFQKYGPFYVLTFDIQPGNLIEGMYLLEEAYISNFLEHAAIDVVEKDYKEVKLTTEDIAAMLDGKTAIVSNQRYTCPDYDAAYRVYYQLGDEENILYIFETDGLLAIQVGYPDEGPKFIAYE